MEWCIGDLNFGEMQMSTLSFQSFCVEYYAKHIGMTGADVYRMFRESGLMKVLVDDYEDLHGLGWEALMPMFDEYLGRHAKKMSLAAVSRICSILRAGGALMDEDHTLIRATLVPAIVAILMGHYGISEGEALDLFYTSKTARAFADDSIGLYGQSALNIAGEVISENERS